MRRTRVLGLGLRERGWRGQVLGMGLEEAGRLWDIERVKWLRMGIRVRVRQIGQGLG